MGFFSNVVATRRRIIRASWVVLTLVQIREYAGRSTPATNPAEIARITRDPPPRPPSPLHRADFGSGLRDVRRLTVKVPGETVLCALELPCST